MKCTHSLQLKEPPHGGTESEYAAEGTAAHAYAEKVLLYKIFGKPYQADLAYDVDMYVDHVSALSDDYGLKVWLEKKVTILAGWCYGTIDFLGYDAERKTVYVVDLKYGKGLQVDAEDNQQLLLYAMGAFKMRGVGEVENVELHIVQPRLNHLSVARYNKKQWLETFAYLTKAVKDTVEKLSEEQDPVLGEHCRFCPVKGCCTAQAERAREVVQTALVKSVDSISLEDVAYMLEVKKDLKAFLDACEARAYAEIKNGNQVPGYAIGDGRKTRKWKEGALDNLSLYYSDEQLYKPREMKTVAQVEKTIGKKELVALDCIEETVSKKLKRDKEIKLDIQKYFVDLTKK
jgi:hypothetical protein